LSYTLDDIAQQEGKLLLIASVIIIACVIWILINPNAWAMLIIIGVLVVVLFAKGNFAEWEDFIDTYSE